MKVLIVEDQRKLGMLLKQGLVEAGFDVITKGITSVDPRWHRTHDPQNKFVVQMPLRDASGENIGLLVLAYRNTDKAPNRGPVELNYLSRAIALRDRLQSRIPSYAALFESAPPKQ